MGKKPERKIPIAMRQKLSDVLGSQASQPGRPLLTTKPGQQVVRVVENASRIVPISQQLVRIEEGADPVGFLINAANGSLFPVQYVIENEETGEMEVVTEYAQYSMADRLKTAKFLANKIIPNISLSAAIPTKSSEEKDESDIGYDEMVDRAAAKARAAFANELVHSARVTDVEEADIEQEAS